MAHTPGHINSAFDDALIEQGTAGGQQPERRNPRPRPTLFDSTAQNLFGEIRMGAGGRSGDLLGTLFGKVLPPSKKQKAAFAQLKKERAEKLKRGRATASARFAAEGGISPTAAAMGAGFDPSVRAGLESAARGEPQAEQTLASLARTTGTPRGRLLAETEEAQLRLAKSEAAVQRRLLPVNVQEQLDRQAREATAFGIKNVRDFQSDVRSNPSLESGMQGLRSFEILTKLLDQPNVSALDIQNSIVAMAQVLEPGLAVRNDDRIAITGSASTGLTRLANFYNQLVSGKIDPEQFRTNARASATAMITPRIQAIRQTRAWYDDLADNIPGVQRGDADAILGITPEAQQLMNQVAPISDFDLTGGG